MRPRMPVGVWVLLGLVVWNLIGGAAHLHVALTTGSVFAQAAVGVAVAAAAGFGTWAWLLYRRHRVANGSDDAS